MNDFGMGPINGHIVGRVLKETVRRAMVVIRNERMAFEINAKQGNSGTMDDVFTSADTKAQAIYLRTFLECFPFCGILGEEGALRLPSSGGCSAYFTVDPLDGTKAYIRRQSHGVGTMIALVHNNEVISAYVGDVNTDEVYGYRPDSSRVHRITRLDTFEELAPQTNTSFKNAYVMLREPLSLYSGKTELLVSQFKNHEIIGSSIGTWMARLWKQEVAAVIMPPGWETPWDSTPIIGISKKLGYVFLRPALKDNGITARVQWEEYEPPLVKKKYYRDHDTLVVNRNDLDHLLT